MRNYKSTGSAEFSQRGAHESCTTDGQCALQVRAPCAFSPSLTLSCVTLRLWSLVTIGCSGGWHQTLTLWHVTWRLGKHEPSLGIQWAGRDNSKHMSSLCLIRSLQCQCLYCVMFLHNIMQLYIQIRIVVVLNSECSEFVNWKSYYQTTIKLLLTNTI